MHAGPNTGLQLAVLERAEQILRNPPTAVPTATPLPTPTLTPIPTEAMYIVQRGDTLSVIASEHGVSVDDIVALNELRTDDFLSVGQMLIIPETDE
jgi:LysM repeat protein